MAKNIYPEGKNLPIFKTGLWLMAGAAVCTLLFYAMSGFFVRAALEKYEHLASVRIFDRQGRLLSLQPNHKGYYSVYLDEAPPLWAQWVRRREDKYFPYHIGLNPASLARAVKNWLLGRENLAASTITQQLAKNLLGQENQRNLKNKIKEAGLALCLEARLSKPAILAMHANTAYFGEQTQGLAEAAQLFFQKPTANLNEAEIISLLAALSSPSRQHPFTLENAEQSRRLAENFGLSWTDQSPNSAERKARRADFRSARTDEAMLEMNSLRLVCPIDCALSLDTDLTKTLRSILRDNLALLSEKKAAHGALAVISVPDRTLLALIGTARPDSEQAGDQINMAIRPRPIGSTLKPFIYLKGLAAGLRPYTLVMDKEYKYTVDNGWAFYPKNYDYRYHGLVNLHYALANSLNVPAVRVLEFVGIKNFGDFLTNDLGLKPIQPIGNYQLGLALGGLEMDLLGLTYYFSALADNGRLAPLRLGDSRAETVLPATENFQLQRTIAPPALVALINRILSDRSTAVDQFGPVSFLALPRQNYAVKTGTSRDYRDSWTIGYTPDYVVGVWIGNADGSPMDEVAGAAGAGRVWQAAMNLLAASSYDQQSAFDFSGLKDFPTGNSTEYGLPADDYNRVLNMLLEDKLILLPHDGDEFLWPESRLTLRAQRPVEWRINGQEIGGPAAELIFTPDAPGRYEITAQNDESSEMIHVRFNRQ